MAVTWGGEFSNASHLMALRGKRCDWQKNWDDKNYDTIKDLVGDLLGTNQILIICSKNISACPSTHDDMVSGTVLSATEFCDFLCARYNFTPLNLQIHCDGCGTTFELRHSLN